MVGVQRSLIPWMCSLQKRWNCTEAAEHGETSSLQGIESIVESIARKYISSSP